ncbi:MAG: hypothetical protein M3340_09675, partial [Actinomycetota bacterium]|nr:hypothetical protein [Actinomycetota bacterium]
HASARDRPPAGHLGRAGASDRGGRARAAGGERRPRRPARRRLSRSHVPTPRSVLRA